MVVGVIGNGRKGRSTMVEKRIRDGLGRGGGGGAVRNGVVVSSGVLSHGFPLRKINRPSPLLVPVPITSIVEVELIKKKLSAIEFGAFLERFDVQEEEQAECAICLSEAGERP
ncbi:hypothetical protein F0562_026789 [Nyssa sinensis]|uniref:RING-type domain-containing protein n=1 Tax=Nyssa sinensis TaxID=561372 RepID=A0A5J5BEJ1_9ASTE|nr:hypothetical protein F0562_026789 [Nyssa sinensis]